METYSKLTSVDPDVFEDISADEAITRYADYLRAVVKSEYSNPDLREAKTFTQWLNTEIY